MTEPEVKNVRYTHTKCCASCLYFSAASIWDEDTLVECDLSRVEWDQYLNAKHHDHDGPGSTICDAWTSCEGEQEQPSK